MWFFNQDILGLSCVHAEFVHFFEVEFTPVVLIHLTNLLTNEDCQARVVICYEIELEKESEGKAVEWTSLKDKEGKPMTEKMPLMFSPSAYTLHIYIRKTPMPQNPPPVLDPKWESMYVHYDTLLRLFMIMFGIIITYLPILS